MQYRFAVALVALGLVAACAHRATAPIAAEPLPSYSSWEDRLDCAADVLRRAGYDVTQDTSGIRASSRGGAIPGTAAYELNLIRISVGSGPAGQDLVLDFGPGPSGSARAHGRIRAFTFEQQDAEPTSGAGGTAALTGPSSSVRAVAYRVAKQCR